jgi:hypothetical protein
VVRYSYQREPPATTDREVAMPNSTATIVRPSDEVLNLRDGWADDKSAATILEAIGHPGYGEAYAREVLAKMANLGINAHEAIYGRFIGR